MAASVRRTDSAPACPSSARLCFEVSCMTWFSSAQNSLLLLWGTISGSRRWIRCGNVLLPKLQEEEFRKLVSIAMAKHSLSAPFTVHLTVSRGQRKNKMVLNRQKVLSRRRKLNVIQVWLFGIISAACAVYKHGLVIALTNANAPYDLFAILGNNWFTRRLGL